MWSTFRQGLCGVNLGQKSSRNVSTCSCSLQVVCSNLQVVCSNLLYVMLFQLGSHQVAAVSQHADSAAYSSIGFALAKPQIE